MYIQFVVFFNISKSQYIKRQILIKLHTTKKSETYEENRL